MSPNHSITVISIFSASQAMASDFIYRMGLLVSPTNIVAGRRAAGPSPIEVAGKRPHNFSMRWHILQIETPQPFILDSGCPLMQQPVSRGQHLLGASVLASLQNQITGQIGLKRLARTVELLDSKLGQ